MLALFYRRRKKKIKQKKTKLLNTEAMKWQRVADDLKIANEMVREVMNARAEPLLLNL